MTQSLAPTKVNIIEAAERLFGLYGINGVSLRQIGLEAGSANKGAITYHFKDLKGLVRAIFEYRLPALEARRREMFAAATGNGGRPSVRDLVAILWAPLREQVDHSGRNSYAAFLAGLTRFHQQVERRKLVKLAPSTTKAAELLAQEMSQLSPDQFWRRFAVVNDMVLNGITQQQNDEDRVPFDELLDMAVAALQMTPVMSTQIPLSRGTPVPTQLDG